MSFESYDHHIIQKHRLAVALAVLKEKPQNVSVEKYLEDIRNKMNNKTNDEIDFTISSDDFNLDDSDNNDPQISINILQHIDNGIISNNDTLVNSTGSVINESVNNDDRNSVMILENVLINDIGSRNKFVDEITNSQESISILKDVINKDEVNGDLYGEKRRKITHDNLELNTTKSEELKFNTNESHIANNVEPTYYNTQAIENAQNDYSNIDEILAIDSMFNKNINTQTSNKFNDTSQNYTHISQSQYNNITFNDILFKSKERFSKDANNNTDKQNNNSNLSMNENPAAIEAETIKDINDKETYRSDLNESLNKYDINVRNIRIGEINEHNKDTFKNNNHIIENNDNAFENINHTIENKSHTFENINHIIENDVQTIGSDSQSGLITFKVIEELNKVKSYLNRNGDRRISGECSLDSGYKSDNQSRSSRSSSQLSGSFLNQSGRCLFDYIIKVRFVSDTQEVTSEIAQVLANLIDRLHEDEKYLCFLDELLETVESLLKETLDGSDDDNFFLKKDEIIHKLLLLNISPHIQKYTIEKIITILQELLNNLNNSEDLYEINRTEESENLCYIFHLLEVLIRRFINSKELIIRSSQNELKKSSITDIWRRKWNPNFKSIETEDLAVNPKGIILKKCAEILNKYIITCINGYSLISFAALQCFNAFQTQ